MGESGAFFKIDGLSLELDPSVTKWSYEDLGDAPEAHRWRAWWAPGDGNIEVGGIELRAYPVLKQTPGGVWINSEGYRDSTKQPWEEGAPAMQWVPFDETWMKKRFILNGSASAWAKPTQEEAIHSLAVRLSRWSNHVARDRRRVLAAANVLEKLRPEYQSYVQHARVVIKGEQ
jgi:hypothetical protein